MKQQNLKNEFNKDIKLDDVDFVSILKYLETYHGVDYSSPTASGLSDETRRKLIQIQADSWKIVEQLKLFGAYCGQKFGLDIAGKISWRDGSNVRIRQYLWVQLKKEMYKAYPVSISVFAELSNDKAHYRVSLELKNWNPNKLLLKKYHQHLNLILNKNKGLVYALGSNEKGELRLLDEEQDLVRERVKSGDYLKVQVCKYINGGVGITNAQYGSQINEAIETIIPYYEYVIKNWNIS